MNFKYSVLGGALTFLATLIFLGCATTRDSDSSPEIALVQKQIAVRLQEVFAAAENKNFQELDSYHLYGPKFSKFTASSPDRLDAEAGQKGEHDGLGSIDNLRMRADSLKVDLFGDTAIATFILDYSFESAGNKVQQRDRSTLVFVKDRGQWKIVHEHLSPITQ